MDKNSSWIPHWARALWAASAYETLRIMVKYAMAIINKSEVNISLCEIVSVILIAIVSLTLTILCMRNRD